MFANSLTLASLCIASIAAATQPTAHVKNGTYEGVHNPDYGVDFFFGVPYAQPPVGDLRLRTPRSLNTTWTDIRNATQYSPSCIGYGEDTVVGAFGYVSEDCLTLNVIRPAGFNEYSLKKLPIALWIYGGGFSQGSTVDGRYNTTFIVEQSVRMGKPIMAVTINYRLSGWGFLLSKEILAEGVANLGLRDQRLALHWVQENIAAFGGDPSKVTIWGQSAGSISVGAHMLAYEGRDDRLFRGAVGQSGAIIGLGAMNVDPDQAEKDFAGIADRVGCSNSSSPLQCLRTAPYETLNNAINSTLTTGGRGTIAYGPYVDNDIVSRRPYDQLKDGNIVNVPYLVGDNSDEGTIFAPYGVNSNQEFEDYHKIMLPWPGVAGNLSALYGNESGELCLQSQTDGFNDTVGSQYRRAATADGDLYLIGARRISLELWLKAMPAKIFNYRFITVPNNVPDPVWGSTHFMEMPFILYNLNGTGYLNVNQPYEGPNPFEGAADTYFKLAHEMSRMWISFFHDLDPNYKGQDAPTWPLYDLDHRLSMTFDANRTSSVGRDIWRKEAIAWYETVIAAYAP